MIEYIPNNIEKSSYLYFGINIFNIGILFNKTNGKIFEFIYWINEFKIKPNYINNDFVFQYKKKKFYNEFRFKNKENIKKTFISYKI
jgi:hypothetical protein